MPPANVCPNCGQKEWLESPSLHYMPRLRSDEKGYSADTEKKVSKMFGVWGKKKFMGREYMGVARSTFLADKKGKIFKVFPKVKPAGHSKEVLECFKNI